MIWLRQSTVFTIACVISVTLMRLLLRESELLFNLRVGLPSLLLGVACAWFSLRRWRFIAPIRSATVLGLCAGIGGAGLFIIIVCAFGYLFPAYFGPAPNS